MAIVLCAGIEEMKKFALANMLSFQIDANFM